MPAVTYSTMQEAITGSRPERPRRHVGRVRDRGDDGTRGVLADAADPRVGEFLKDVCVREQL